jgi:hypothetical protein
MATSLSPALLADADALTSSIVAVAITSSVVDRCDNNDDDDDDDDDPNNGSRVPLPPSLAPPLVLAMNEPAWVDENNDDDGQVVVVDARR